MLWSMRLSESVRNNQLFTKKNNEYLEETALETEFEEGFCFSGKMNLNINRSSVSSPNAKSQSSNSLIKRKNVKKQYFSFFRSLKEY